jgi:hypothetical protein
VLGHDGIGTSNGLGTNSGASGTIGNRAGSTTGCTVAVGYGTPTPWFPDGLTSSCSDESVDQ